MATRPQDEPTYEDRVDIVGEVRVADLDRQSFVLRVDGDLRIPGRLDASSEPQIADALRDHLVHLVRIIGRGEFRSSDRALLSISSVIYVIPEKDPSMALPMKPLWERIAEIGNMIPPEEWEKIPKDASRNLDKYLYGQLFQSDDDSIR